jgi:hypothetical protein
VGLQEDEEVETDRQPAYTIASLVVGAGTAVVARVRDLANADASTPVAEDAPAVISIAGAVATTALGVPVLVREPREIVALHERNILAPVVTGDEPELLYPRFVFAMLTLPAPDGGPSPRETLVEDSDGALGELESGERLATARVILDGGEARPE